MSSKISVIHNIVGSAGHVLNEKSIKAHAENTSNPHKVTKEQLGIAVDSVLREGSGNLITSGAVFEAVGDIETALDSIIAMQNELTGVSE